MAVLAEARADELAEGLARIGPPQDWRYLRAPEIGLVMVRGRIGGDGRPFNLGEATVTRCAVALPSGTVGHSYLLGRHADRARDAALLDALGQEEESASRVDAFVLEPVRKRVAADAERARRRTAATKVDFFTMVRGED